MVNSKIEPVIFYIIIKINSAFIPLPLLVEELWVLEVQRQCKGAKGGEGDARCEGQIHRISQTEGQKGNATHEWKIINLNG